MVPHRTQFLRVLTMSLVWNTLLIGDVHSKYEVVPPYTNLLSMKPPEEEVKTTEYTQNQSKQKE